LRGCCRLLDGCQALREPVARDGVTVPGSNGQPRVHPALGELRQHRLALGRLLGQLSLPDVDDVPLRIPLQARGHQGAAARWKGYAPVHGSLGSVGNAAT
jgi:hypothetical protein